MAILAIHTDCFKLLILAISCKNLGDEYLDSTSTLIAGPSWAKPDRATGCRRQDNVCEAPILVEIAAAEGPPRPPEQARRVPGPACTARHNLPPSVGFIDLHLGNATAQSTLRGSKYPRSGIPQPARALVRPGSAHCRPSSLRRAVHSTMTMG